MDYRLWAVLSALFAGATAVLSKKGVQEVPSNLALAIRVVFVLVLTVGIAYATKQTRLAEVSGRAWLFLGLSAIATGLSWLCYFRALEGGPIAQVAPIDKLSFVVAMILGAVFLRERISWNVGAGAAVIACGVLLTLRQ